MFNRTYKIPVQLCNLYIIILSIIKFRPNSNNLLNVCPLFSFKIPPFYSNFFKSHNINFVFKINLILSRTVNIISRHQLKYLYKKKRVEVTKIEKQFLLVLRFILKFLCI